MAKKDRFTILSNFKGYRNKTDKTNLGEGYLVEGSQNVIMLDGERVASRQGYEIVGASNSSIFGIEGSFEFQTSRGLEIPIRAYDDELEFLYGGTWYRLEDGFSSARFNFTEYWDTSESQNAMLAVNGGTDIYYWSGGITTFDSATAGPNTITKQGTTTWAEEGFVLNGTRAVVIDGVEYTYTGGENTTTLTGVGTDPTLAGHAEGAVIHQKIKTSANSASTGGSLPTNHTNDLILVFNNQVYLGSLYSQDVYVSKVNSYTDYQFGSPRLISEGAIIRPDSPPVAFAAGEESFYIFAGKDSVFDVSFQLSSDLTQEELIIKKLKASTGGSAIGQSSVANMKNYIVYVSNEPTLDQLGRIENIDTTQSKPLSDPIKRDYDSYTHTNTHVLFHKNNIYQTLPSESKLLIYNVEKGFWEAPWTLPAGRLAVIGGELHLHSNVVPETYKLFTGYNDNGNDINAIAAFSYMNYGNRAELKSISEQYSEGYIAENTILTRTTLYDYQGHTAITEHDIDGADDGIIFGGGADGSLGTTSLGDQILGGDGEEDDIRKFRVVHDVNTQGRDFYELQEVYSSNGADQRWELLATGSDAEMSKNIDSYIKR